MQTESHKNLPASYINEVIYFKSTLQFSRLKASKPLLLNIVAM